MARGLFESRAKARAAIEAGGVIADGRAVAKPGELIAEDAAVEARAAHPWVGRGALKLVHALDLWGLPVEGRVVLDVGASTGGFTEVCLSRGATRVFSVDVGHGQLHPRIASDPRVTALEGMDARRLTSAEIDQSPDLIVCDVSFIGLAKVLPIPLALAPSGADLVTLVKPQFEVGPARVGKGGLVTDPEARAEALAGAAAFLKEAGWPVRASCESPITGGDGNVEFLVWATRQSTTA